MVDRLKRPLPAALLIGLIAQCLFAWRVTVPHQLVFDEVHYVPAARTLAALSHPVNVEHPLLGKLLIALGIAIFGDGPLGWRALSTVAGTAVVVGVFAILWIGTQRLRPAVIGSLLVIVNFTVFIQARIAMLDGFMAAFVVVGAALLLASMRARGRTMWLLWMSGALCLGLATACKWVAGPYVAAAALAFLILHRQRPDRWSGMNPLAALAVLGLISIGTYFITFAPAFFYRHDALTLHGLLAFQWEMYRKQTQVLPAHTYQSSWWTWPLDLRAIWYLYEPADGAQRGILMIGNPAILWGGLIAVLACAIGWVRTRGTAVGTAAMLWLFSIAIWAAIPKSLGFFYYYYLSSIWLPIGIAVAFDRLGGRFRQWDEAFLTLSVALFVLFYPIIAATALPDPQAFNRWMWFDSWR
jgi:dolichyl-phosphate-mannose-protein mannosyltransferase